MPSVESKPDHAGFADLIRQHESMVFSIAYHFLRDRPAAEEIAQEVFVHLSKNLLAIQSPSHLAFWLRKVTTHRCIDETRRRKNERRISLTDYLDHAPEPAAPGLSSDPMLADLLRKLIATLPERSRMIVILRFQEDLEPTEIAATLNIPLNSVKSALHRSLMLLRGKLERERKGVAK